MDFFILVLLVCLLIFLGSLYFLANDDLVLLRKDTSLERVFDIALVMAFSSLLSARILYVILNPSSGFLNPLVFFLFPYFPGLSLTGGVVGALFAFFLFYARESKAPVGRLLDFFSIAFLVALSVGLLGFVILSWGQEDTFPMIGLIVAYIALLAVVIKFYLPEMLRGELRDGTITLIILLSFSAVSLLANFIQKQKIDFSIEEWILIVLFLSSLALLAKQHRLHYRLMEKVREKLKR